MGNNYFVVIHYKGYGCYTKPFTEILKAEEYYKSHAWMGERTMLCEIKNHDEFIVLKGQEN